MKNGRYIFSYFLLLLMCLLTLRFIFFISFIQAGKSEFRAQLKTNLKQLTKLEFSAKDLYVNKAGIEWKENNSELVINGVYHEVIQIKKVAQKFVVFVTADKKENELMQNYYALNKKAQDSDINFLKLFLTLTYLTSSFDLALNNQPTTAYKPAVGTSFSENDYFNKSVKPPEC